MKQTKKWGLQSLVLFIELTLNQFDLQNLSTLELLPNGNGSFLFIQEIVSWKNWCTSPSSLMIWPPSKSILCHVSFSFSGEEDLLKENL